MTRISRIFTGGNRGNGEERWGFNRGRSEQHKKGQLVGFTNFWGRKKQQERDFNRGRLEQHKIGPHAGFAEYAEKGRTESAKKAKKGV